MFGFPRPNVRSHSAHKRLEVAAGQLCALVFAGIVAALLQVPLAADQVAEANPPPPPSELVQERTASSRTFDNHDGTFTTSLYSGPVHFRDDEGQRQWEPISSALIPSDETGYAYENEANRFRALFKQQLGADYLAIQTGDARFKVSLQGATQVAAQTRTRGIAYPSVFPGVTLRYDLQPDGVKETLLLANAQVPLSYRFVLSPPAGARMHAVHEEDGSWSFYMAPYARPVFVIEAPWAAENDEPDPRRQHASLDVTRNGSDFLLDLSVDRTWLRDPLRQFPVRIDPTLMIQPTTQDASFDFACPLCAGVASDRLPIGRSNAPSATWRSALQFNLADIPAGATVSNANLKLYFDGTCVPIIGVTCGGTSHQVDALKMTGSWSKTSLTAQLAFNATPLTSFTLPSGASAQWMNWNLTSTVQSWVSGSTPNFGLLLKRATEPTASSGPKPPSRGYAPEPTLGPKLEVTYNGNGGELLEPETVHSDGAELRWIPYTGPGAPPFDRYEVHRSTVSNFAPSESTRITVIKNSAITSYRDTTAKAGGTFTYKVVASGVETNARTLVMPADGQARKLLQPDPAAGQDTYVTYRTDSVDCTNRGTSDRIKTGTDVNSLFRSLVRFDLSDLPIDTTISDATLSLWHPNTTAAALTVKAHRLTGSWKAGGGKDTCTGDGATWYESDGGVSWLQNGADFDATAAATLAVPIGQAAGWHTFGLTSLAQGWANGANPNQGVLLKVQDETIVSGKYIDYYGSDFSVAPTLRPKLSVTYSDGSHAAPPSVAVTAPKASVQVSGSTVTISAGAIDDRRVESVQFLVDGAAVGTDTSRPFSIVWNSTDVSNGLRNLTARATDDAGNQTTSAAVGISVGNSPPPTSSITSPANLATVTGTVNVIASATDAGGVTKVVFTVDGVRVGEDTSDPYTASWNTLSASLPAYDGPHVLRAKAYDTHGQSTTSAPISVTVANAVGTRYLADITATGIPSRVEYDASAQNQQSLTVPVTVTNKSTLVWPAGEVVLRYRWVRADGSTVDNTQSFSLGTGPLLPNGSTTPINVPVGPPTPTAGVARESYRLRFDLFDQPSSSWFAARGNQPLEDGVGVGERNQEPALGLEPFYTYDSEDLGGGMQHLVNVATGNSIVRWIPLAAPGEGLDTAVSLTYNSREGACNHQYCPAGEGWSLGVSGLTRLGRHQFDPHGNDRVLVDADGTMYRFTWDSQLDRWKAPGGVHLYLREVDGTDEEPDREWAVTSPDRVTSYYDGHGNPISVWDGNENRLRFITDDEPEAPSQSHKRVRQVIDQGGRSFQLDYYDDDGEAPDPESNHRLHFITDHLGHTFEFFYDHGSLTRVVEVGGTSANGSLPDRTFRFAYEGGGNGLLASVTDPRGNSTSFTYAGTGNNRKLATRLDRTQASQALTSFSYGTNSTTVTAPLSHVSVYHHLTTNRDMFSVDSIQNPAGETTTIAWTEASQNPPQPERHPRQVTEPGGSYSQYLYNLNGLVTEEGMLTDRKGAGTGDDIVSTTRFGYEDSKVEGDDSGPLALSDLVERTDPKGVATPGIPDDYRWQYSYYERSDHQPNGNLRVTTDPTGAMTNYYYYEGDRWKLERVVDANSQPTTFAAYDENGFATEVTDAQNHVTLSFYDGDGLLRWVEDAQHHGYSGDEREYRTVNDYDSFHRLDQQSTPKSTELERGKVIWTQTTYDANNNVVASRQGDYRPGAGDLTTTEYDLMDRQIRVDAPGVNKITTFAYDAAGRLTQTTLPKGVLTANLLNDYVIENTYDLLDRVVIETYYDAGGTPTRKTYSCYAADKDDLLWLTAAKAALPAPADCNESPSEIPDYTMQFAYDDAHRITAETDPLGQTATTEYDLNGNTTVETDELGVSEDRTFDQRNAVVEDVQTFQQGPGIPTRILTTKLEYDPVGNLKREISPRAWDAAGGNPPFTDYVTEYQYDELDRVVRTDLPTAGVQQRTYIHRSYDATGNLAMTSLPVETTNPGAIPAELRTNLEYFDPGGIAQSDDHVLKAASYDYTAEGWQSSRTTDNSRGRKMTWEYTADGQLAVARDRQGNFSSYRYDPNGNMTLATEGRGQGRRPLRFQIESTYDGFDEPVKTRIKEDGATNWTYTAFGYDLNGNVTSREDNGEETTVGQLVSNGRLHTLVYDFADELTSDTDLGNNHSLGDGDRQLSLTYWPTGWQKTDVLSRRNGNDWVAKRSSDSIYFANGDLATSTTRRGDASAPIAEQHSLGYEEVLQNGRTAYVNGSRTRDAFVLHGPPGPGLETPCETTCTTTYGYGVRENLVSETRARGTQSETTQYALDPTMNVKDESLEGSLQRHYDYTGTRLDKVTDYTGGIPPVVQRHLYDSDGNLDCITDVTWLQADTCPAAPGQGGSVDPRLIKDFAWDYQSRPQRYRRFESGSLRDDAVYDHDPLDRLYEESETHPSTPTRTTTLNYFGASKLVSQDVTGSTARTYTYDPADRPLTLTFTEGSPPTTTGYAYSSNPHTDVSLLTTLSSSSAVIHGSYGYRAYGNEDSALTKGDNAGANQLNPYRFSRKRFDSGASNIDMGARRYEGTIGRFLQRDMLPEASSDLGLAQGTTSQNRFVLAAGNPISFVEGDGHTAGPVEGEGEAVQFAGKRPRYRFFKIPFLPSRGLVTGGHFIATKTLGVRPIRGDGDDRMTPDGKPDFNPYADGSQYRAAYRFNYRRGRGWLRVNPSCKVGRKKCYTPHEIRDFPRCNLRVFRCIIKPIGIPSGTPGRSSNRLGVWTDDDKLTVRVQLTHSVTGVSGFLRASIDSWMQLTPAGSNRLRLKIEQDGFPSFELYQRVGSQIRALCKNRERSPIGLSGAWWRRKDCDNW